MVGPYGGTNVGDDAIMFCIMRSLARLGLEALISCSDPDLVRAMTGARTLPLLNLRRLETTALRAIASVDAVVIGGGQQLSQPRLPNPVWGHLANTCHLVRRAAALGKPSILWGVGMDWPLAAISRMLVRASLSGSSVTLLMRDDISLRQARQLLGQAPCTIERTADPVFGLPSGSPKMGRAEIFRHLGALDRGQPLVMLSPVNDKLTPLAYLDPLVEVGRRLADRGFTVFGWHSDNQSGYDVALRNRTCWSRIPGFVWLPAEPLTASQAANLVAGVSLLLTARLHPAIIAVTQGVRVAALDRSPKMTAILGELGIASALIADCSEQGLANLVERTLELPPPDADLLEAQRALVAGAERAAARALGLHEAVG